MLIRTTITVLFTALTIAFSSSYAQECCTSESKTEYKASNDSKETTTVLEILYSKPCPVSGNPVDSKGEPVKFTYLKKVYKFCSSECVKKFKLNPIKYIKGKLKCPVMGNTVDP